MLMVFPFIDCEIEFTLYSLWNKYIEEYSFLPTVSTDQHYA